MVDMALIAKGKTAQQSKAKQFGPFTSVISCAAMLGIYIGMASILF